MKVAITEQYLYDIADAIRTKNGKTDLYKPTEMAQAIRDLCQEEGGVVVDGIIQDSWETIIASTQNGKYRDWYQIGDMKPLDLGTEGTVNMQIVAFDADELADGTGYAPITWISKELLATKHNMNSTNISTGGWPATAMREYLKSTIKPLIPTAMSNEIKEVTKYSADISSTDVSSIEDVWIPSYWEIFGRPGFESRGPVYASVFDADSRKKIAIGGTSASTWWLRSASLNTSFKTIVDTGAEGGSRASSNQGIALGFCL